MSKKVLYICTGNRFRSLFAEAYTRKNYSEIKTASRGTAATTPIIKEVKKEMKERNVWKESKKNPEQLLASDIQSFGCKVCMTHRHQTYLKQNFNADCEHVWNIKDVSTEISKSKMQRQISEAFDSIENKVDELVKKL